MIDVNGAFYRGRKGRKGVSGSSPSNESGFPPAPVNPSVPSGPPFNQDNIVKFIKIPLSAIDATKEEYEEVRDYMNALSPALEMLDINSKLNIIIDDGTTIQCGTSLSFSGGVSYPNTKEIVLGSSLGLVTLNYDGTGIPDRFIVIFDNQRVIDTGYRGAVSYDFGGTNRTTFKNSLTNRIDPVLNTVYPDTVNFPDDGYPRVLGLGLGSTTFNKTTSTPDVTVNVYGPNSNTGWHYSISCPDGGTIITYPRPKSIYELQLNGKGLYGAGQKQITVNDLLRIEERITSLAQIPTRSYNDLQGLPSNLEWSALTVTQAEAEAGLSIERKAWTPERVKQAIIALTPTTAFSADDFVLIDEVVHLVLGGIKIISKINQVTGDDRMGVSVLKDFISGVDTRINEIVADANPQQFIYSDGYATISKLEIPTSKRVIEFDRHYEYGTVSNPTRVVNALFNLTNAKSGATATIYQLAGYAFFKNQTELRLEKFSGIFENSEQSGGNATLTVTGSPGTNDRIDSVEMDDQGTYYYRVGTESASPVALTLTVGRLLLLTVLRTTAGVNTISKKYNLLDKYPEVKIVQGIYSQTKVNIIEITYRGANYFETVIKNTEVSSESLIDKTTGLQVFLDFESSQVGTGTVQNIAPQGGNLSIANFAAAFFPTGINGRAFQNTVEGSTGAYIIGPMSMISTMTTAFAIFFFHKEFAAESSAGLFRSDTGPNLKGIRIGLTSAQLPELTLNEGLNGTTYRVRADVNVLTSTTEFRGFWFLYDGQTLSIENEDSTLVKSITATNIDFVSDGSSFLINSNPTHSQVKRHQYDKYRIFNYVPNIETRVAIARERFLFQ